MSILLLTISLRSIRAVVYGLPFEIQLCGLFVLSNSIMSFPVLGSLTRFAPPQMIYRKAVLALFEIFLRTTANLWVRLIRRQTKRGNRSCALLRLILRIALALFGGDGGGGGSVGSALGSLGVFSLPARTSLAFRLALLIAAGG
jgi:hypothetical protein